MPLSKANTNAAEIRSGPPQRGSKIPALLRFPLLVILSLSLSSLLYASAAEYTTGDLASISRSLNKWWEVGTLVTWRIFELGIGWFGSYDSYDLASLSLLSHGPPLYLLTTFYDIPTTTTLTSLLIDTLTTYIPFRLLRPLSQAHATSQDAPNRVLTTDLAITSYTTLLAAGIYALALYVAYASYLPATLAAYNTTIPSVAAAHSATLVTLFPLMLPLGVAARSFIFTPATAVAPNTVPDFDPVRASFWQTLSWNLTGFRPRTKVVIGRTLVLMLVCGVNTFVQTFVTVQGVEWQGAVAFSAVWVAAAAVAGAVLGFVGDV